MKQSEDKRVIKTKSNLKNTLKEMLKEMPLEKITVKEICERAMTSRITFYNYYSDKYALLEDIFSDIGSDMDQRFLEKQRRNEADDPMISYQNLLDCFIDLYNEDIFPISIEKNTALLMPYYRFMVDTTTSLVRKYTPRLKPNYPAEKISIFIVTGMYGYIHLAKWEKKDKRLYESAHSLLSDLLHSHIFTVNK
ncbi:MAG: TetR/AcrR family transcriptional regulator [Bilifractor sp.]|jgi:AcrR family transcriptional regulator